MTVQDSSLLLTKLYAPVPRRTHVERHALLEQLQTGLDGKLIVVVAAAGFGKTTLLAEWCDRHVGEVGWLSLEQSDNELLRFFTYLVAAIQSVQAQFGERLSHQLQSAHPPGVEDILYQIINQMAALPQRLIVVLDDYHAIDNPAVHAAMAFLLDHLPPRITFVLATRSDPPLPVARLRAGNDLLEVRADRLRFSIAETTHFLNESMQLALPIQAVEALDRRTEGWITGLQLAALAIQTLPGDFETFIDSFTGSHRFILDYLIEEVLSRQPEHVQLFLRYTAILFRFNAPLCQAITGNTDSQAMLDYLDKHNLFLVPLDQSRQWYRYHHLFAGLLQARLQTDPVHVSQDLYRRAADWYAANGMAEDAVSYALAAQAFDTATALIAGAAAGAVQRGDVFTLLNWYKAFPPNVIVKQPVLSLQFGIAFALNGRWQEAESLLNQVERHSESPLEARIMLTYLVGSYRHDAKRLAQVAEAASDAPMIFLARALLASLHGDLRAANALLIEARLRSEQAGNQLLAMTALFHECRFDVFLGELRQTQDLSQKALAQVAGQPMACFAYTALGRVMIEWNDLAAADDYLLKAIRLSELSGFLTGMVSSATMMQAEVKQAQGDSAAANSLAQAALNYARRNDPPNEVLWLQIYQVRLWLIQGNIELAADWWRSIQLEALPDSIFYPANVFLITHARLLLAQRQFDPGVALLTQYLTGSSDLFTVEALAILALARQATGDSTNALLTLQQALSLAEVENRIRVFLDLGTSLAHLLLRFCEANPEHSYAKKLLTIVKVQPTPAEQVLSERLSDRELEVLQLIVAGYSNDEIAQRLIIAVSTVKWYVNTLFSKLQVKTRAQAIAQTRTLKLFE